MDIFLIYIVGVVVSLVINIILNFFVRNSKKFRNYYHLNVHSNVLTKTDILLYSTLSWFWVLIITLALIAGNFEHKE